MNKIQTVGIIGGGQLGRMLTMAAIPLGFKVVVLERGDTSPASQVGAEQISGNIKSAEDIGKLAKVCDYMTIEVEHVNVDAMEQASVDGVSVNPKPSTVGLIQDKYIQKGTFHSAGLPVVEYAVVGTKDELKTVWEEFGKDVFLKSRTGAFDGRGNYRITNEADIDKAFDKLKGGGLYVEKTVNIDKELAVVVARDINNEVKMYPVVEIVHERSICTETIASAIVDTAVADRATQLAADVLEHLEGAGVFAVEMMLTTDGDILINEVAPRVHNSGHYTMDACVTGQFEQHIRAITGLPLGDTRMLDKACVMHNILGEENHEVQLSGLQEALRHPGCSVHIYGKSPTKVDRKMGHINVVAPTAEEAQRIARLARKAIRI